MIYDTFDGLVLTKNEILAFQNCSKLSFSNFANFVFVCLDLGHCMLLYYGVTPSNSVSEDKQEKNPAAVLSMSLQHSLLVGSMGRFTMRLS